MATRRERRFGNSLIQVNRISHKRDIKEGDIVYEGG